MESAFRTRKTVRLKDRRISMAGARYFVTLCVADRARHLVKAGINDPIFAQLEHQEEEGDLELLCGTVMPDHLHVVLRLGNRISLSQTIAKFKSKTKELVSWQNNYYEHRIRSDESEESYAFYVFMNPYADDLCGLEARWPWWRRWKTAPYEFEELMASSDSIPVHWIEKEKAIRKKLLI